MHYYGTYAMACAAGILPAASQVIATSAQYVDDSDVFQEKLDDGMYIEAAATAHHPIDKNNVDHVDQCKIWVPFHFLPGNQGDTLTERLICRMDSPLAREMVDHNLTFADSGFALELMGITAHVYADTFSHYGFSGISSPLNKVEADSIQLNAKDPKTLQYIINKFSDFKDKYIAGNIADLVALGHGSVGTYPDRPYLNWNFKYEDGRTSGTRENKQTFLEACRQLHRVFTEFVQKKPEFLVKDMRREFDDIEKRISKILATEGDMGTRINAWQRAVTGGHLFDNPEKNKIPEYDNASFDADRKLLPTFKRDAVESASIFQFLNAAKTHRNFVLDVLLPKHELSVIRRM
ncbi:MAG TPA: hypothetical protein DFK12_07350 [Gallionellaceae bacterium]|nr:hypothetical protein [Gallionellaceae bacterium]